MNADKTKAPIYRQPLSKLLCLLGVHGPEWFGCGCGVTSPRNKSIEPGVRRCLRCGAEWRAYEKQPSATMRRMGWEKQKRGAA